MLPSARKSLIDGDLSPSAASWVLIACFIGGVFGIKILTKVFHRFLPSHAVDCHHTHEDESSPGGELQDEHHGHAHGRAHSHGDHSKHTDGAAETTPLLSHAGSSTSSQHEMSERHETDSLVKPSLHARVASAVSLAIASTRRSCGVDGPCHGYSDPCGEECFRNVASRGVTKRSHPGSHVKRPALRAAETMPEPLDLQAAAQLDGCASLRVGHPESPEHGDEHDAHSHHHQDHDVHDHEHHEDRDLEAGNADGPHHHHIPTNAFLSISLQTSVAIALHKLPEGFIAYAANHANPRLGLSVFVALAVHNLSEGFALALPIFLASGSRLRAVTLSALLGGLSQPLGAGIAAAWLGVADRGRGQDDGGQGINDTAYGGLFAATAGIMASVALSLLQEGFERSHERERCMVSAFIGMGILGMSSALVA